MKGEKMKFNIGKQDWQKRNVIERILEELKENNKTIKDIKYIIRRGQIEYSITWEEFISPKIKIKDYNTLDFIIVGGIDKADVNDERDCQWFFRTKPKCPKFNLKSYTEWENKNTK